MVGIFFQALSHWHLVVPYGDRSGLTLTQVKAWCLTAPKHYLDQCWLIMKCVVWYSLEGNFSRSAHKFSPSHVFGDCTLKDIGTFPRVQWVNVLFVICGRRWWLVMTSWVTWEVPRPRVWWGYRCGPESSGETLDNRHVSQALLLIYQTGSA